MILGFETLILTIRTLNSRGATVQRLRRRLSECCIGGDSQVLSLEAAAGAPGTAAARHGSANRGNVVHVFTEI